MALPVATGLAGLEPATGHVDIDLRGDSLVRSRTASGHIARRALHLSAVDLLQRRNAGRFVEAGVQNRVGRSPSGTKMAHRPSIARPPHVALSRS
jgi:hypothetical protein